MLIIYQGKTEISAQTDTERPDSRQFWGAHIFACACTHTLKHARTHTLACTKGELYADCPSDGKKKWKYIKKQISLAIILQTLYALTLPYLHSECVSACLCLCAGMAAYRQAVIHLGI